MPLGGAELLILLVIILLFFGARRVPGLARSLGVGARELKRAVSEDEDQDHAKEPDKVEAREHREETRPIQQEDARPEEPSPEAEPNTKA